MLRKIRIALAAVFFTLTTLLFLDFTGTIHAYLGWLAKIQLLPAILAGNVVVVVALLLITLLLGRTYCSVICPMGVMQDIFSFFGGKVWKNRFHYTKNRPWLRWSILVIFVALMILGLNAIAILIAPYSAFGRIATNILQPVYIWINNIFAYLAERADSYAFYHVDVWVKAGASLIVAAVTLVGIGLLAFRYGRSWCNNICPVGTLLGFVSKYSIFGIQIDESKCVKCHKCERNCKASCIDVENHTVDHSRCVACMNCIDQCRQGGISYGLRKRGQKAAADTVDTSRRKMLATTAAVGTAMAVKAQEVKMDGGLAVIEDRQAPDRKTAIKPAGSRCHTNFNKHCTACQLCVSECPSRILKPSTSLQTLMQPEIDFENGYCRIDCNRCSQVCPTGAIQKIDIEDKTNIRIGHAVWISQNCLLSEGEACGLCQRNCPTEAILMVDDLSTGHKSISVNESKCIGCGKCEHLCPSRPLGAIYVEGHENHICL